MSRANFSDHSTLSITPAAASSAASSFRLRPARDRHIRSTSARFTDPLDLRIPSEGYQAFLEGLTHIAASRIESVKRYACDFARLADPDLTTTDEYERRRAECVYHMAWIMSELPSNRIRELHLTFRDLCGLIELGTDCGCCDQQEKKRRLTVSEARRAILRCFSCDAVQSLTVPVSARLIRRAESNWLMDGPMTKPSGRRGRKVKGENEQRKNEQREDDQAEIGQISSATAPVHQSAHSPRRQGANLDSPYGEALVFSLAGDLDGDCGDDMG